MANLFGWEGGVEAAQQDQMKQQAFNLNMAMGKTKLAMENLQLQREHNLSEMMKNFKPQDAKGPGGMVYNTGLMALANGDLHGAEAAFSSAQRLAIQQKDAALKQTNLQMHQYQQLGKLMDSVHDEASWSAANLAYQAMFNKQSPFANAPYNPNLVGTIRRFAISAKDDALTKAALARQRAEAVTTEVNQHRIKLIDQETQNAAQRATRYEKVTGTKPPKATAATVKLVQDRISNDFDVQPGSQSSDLSRALSTSIAQRAAEMREVNPKLNLEDSIEKAYQEYRQRPGYFEGLKNKADEVPGGLDNPIPAKRGMTPQEGAYYRTYDGKTVRWAHGQWLPVK